MFQSGWKEVDGTKYYFNGYGIGDDHKGRLSFELTQYPPPGILVYRYEKGKGDKPVELALKEARTALRPGDVIAYANVTGEMRRRGGLFP